MYPAVRCGGLMVSYIAAFIERGRAAWALEALLECRTRIGNAAAVIVLMLPVVVGDRRAMSIDRVESVHVDIDAMAVPVEVVPAP